MKSITATFWLSILLAALPLTASAAFKEVGNAQMIRGTVTAEQAEQEARTLEKASPIYESDHIKTGAKSFAVIRLKDGTRITVRPDSELGIKKYTFEEDKEEAEYDLVKGGMRAITGLMGKKDPDTIKVKTAYATMGIRGTSYDVRLCDADCVAEQQQKNGAQALTSLVIGRAANLDGIVTVTDTTGHARRLSDGGPLYAGDRVSTQVDASTLLVFRDDTRLAMQPGSELILNDYAYDIGAKGTTYTAADANVDLQDLFGTREHDYSKPGAYVTVYDGHVRVSKPVNASDKTAAK
jgi:hypothetical protein